LQAHTVSRTLPLPREVLTLCPTRTLMKNRTSRREFLFKSLLAGAAAPLAFLKSGAARLRPLAPPAAEAADSAGWKLWYDKPAAVWVEALPLGNGRLAAMVFGGTASERLQLNE